MHPWVYRPPPPIPQQLPPRRAALAVLPESTALLWTTFETGTQEGWVDVQGDPRVDTVHFYSRPFSLRLGNVIQASFTLPTGVPALFLQYYIFLDNNWGSNTHHFRLRNTGGGTIGQIAQIGSKVAVDFRNEIVPESYNGSQPFKFGVWNRVELHIGIGATTGFVKLTINGVVSLDVSAKNLGTVNLGSFRMGDILGSFKPFWLDSVEARQDYAPFPRAQDPQPSPEEQTHRVIFWSRL